MSERLVSVIHGPDFGGAHNQLLRLSAPLRERGFETVAVLSEEANGPTARFREAGIETHQIPLGRLRATPNPVVQARFAARLRSDLRRLVRLLTDSRADVVQAHGPTNPQAALAAARADRRPGLVWQLLDTRAPMLLRRLTMPLVLKHADAVTCWGRELARVHPGAERLGERLIFVFPPVAAAALAPDPQQRALARQRLGIPEGAVAVGTLAVRNPQKGIEWLIRAAGQVAERHPQVVFRVLGAPSAAHASYERDLREEARELGLGPPALEFVDPGEDSHLLLQALDVFALTSVPRSEGVPTVILEAMAAEKPVVATDVGAVREIVEHEASGLVVPAEDPGGIADAVSRLVADGGARADFGAEGRRLALERFDLGQLVDRHARAYELAIARRRSR